MRVVLFERPDPETAERLVRMERLLRITLEDVENIMANMDDLRAAVQRNSSAEQSVVALIQGLSQQLKDAQAQNNPQAIQDVINQMDQNSQALASAVTANTQSGGGGQAPQPAPQPAPQNQQNPTG